MQFLFQVEFYPHKINHDSIVIDGHTGNITFKAMRWLSKHNINLTLLNWNGQLLANTVPEQPKSGKLRIKQYQKYLDSTNRFEIALKIVQTKVEHSLNLLEELSRFYESVDIISIRKSVEKEDLFLLGIMKNSVKQDISKSIKQLMTYEGRIAGIYLDNLTAIFYELYPEFNFTGRKNKSNSRNYNASDEINALLNYGYAILESKIRKDINSVGLDYSIGFLHEINRSRTPLVYDIQELFRWLIDVSVIQLLEKKKIKKSDFIITENYHTRLGEDIAKLLIEKINSNFNARHNYKNNKQYSYQIILQDNLQQLSNFIIEKKKEFDFIIPKMKVNRNDNLELRTKILSMMTNTGNKPPNFSLFFINSVSIRFRELSFRYQFGDVNYQFGEMFREITRDSERLIDDVYQFGINSEVFPRLPKKRLIESNVRILDYLQIF